MNPGEEGEGEGVCSSCSFEAFVSRPVTRARREQERVTREHERAAGGCGEDCWQGCYERSINAAASIHPWTHISLTCRLPLASHSIPLPLCPSSIALFLLVLPLSRTFARRASKLFPSLARYDYASRYNEREKGSPRGLPMYSCAELYTIASRESHRRRWLRNDRHDRPKTFAPRRCIRV